MRISDWSSDVCSSDLEAKERHPLINEKRFLGALHDPMEGHVDPAGVTQAYAKSARIAGAEIERFTRVVELHPTSDGGCEVVTDKGPLKADNVVNCGGLWPRVVGRMVGLELPVVAMEPHYLTTADMQEGHSPPAALPTRF